MAQRISAVMGVKKAPLAVTTALTLMALTVACSSTDESSPGTRLGRITQPLSCSIARPSYINNFPKDREANWNDKLQGVAHDDGNWYFTNERLLRRIAFQTRLDANVPSSNPPAGIPPHLADLGANHFGDLDQDGGLLFVPLEGSTPPILAVFRASDLGFHTSVDLPLHTHAPFVAIDPVRRELVISKSNHLDDDSPLINYLFDIDAAWRGEPFLSDPINVTLTDEAGTSNLGVPGYLQGAAYSPDGCSFFLVNGKAASGTGKIWVIDPASNRVVHRSANNSSAGQFGFEHHSGLFNYEEPEGLTFVNLDGGQAPFISGSLHVILLSTQPGHDGLYFKHYR